MAMSEARLQLLASGFRMIRIAWIVVFLGMLARLFEMAVWQLEVAWPPWIFILGLALSVIGLVRCLIASPDGLARLWLLFSLASIGCGIAWSLTEQNDSYVSLGYIVGAFLFHIYAMRMSNVLGLLDSLAELTRLMFWPIVFFVGLVCFVFVCFFWAPLLWMVPLGISVAAIVGPLVWLKKLLATLLQIEKEIA